jgi:hemerythrin superfamily protein
MREGVPMSVLEVLKKDHSTVKRLFDEFESAGKTAFEKKAELFDKLRQEIFLHSKAEEEIFYPALKVLSDEGRELVSHAVKDHHDVDESLTQISRINTRDERFDERVFSLREDVEHHIDVEEGEIFQFATKNCPEEQLEEMAVEIQNRKKALERQWAA